MQEGAQAVAAAEATHGATLRDDAAGLRDRAMGLLKKAEDAGDLRTALMGVREASRCLELMAKLAGEMPDGPTVNVLVAPQFIAVQGVILAALADFPAARAAVVQALETVK
jgi:hypothetical protein